LSLAFNAHCAAPEAMSSAVARCMVSITERGTLSGSLPASKSVLKASSLACRDMAQPLAPRRRLFALSASLTAGVLAAPAIARADDGTEDTLDRIARTKTFNLGVRDAAPPYGWKDANGTYQGFATGIARAIHAEVSKELGTTIALNLTPVTSQTRLPLLQNGTIDMEAGATVVTQARARIVDFCVAHLATSTEVMVPADSPIKSLADLAGMRVSAARWAGGARLSCTERPEGLEPSAAHDRFSRPSARSHGTGDRLRRRLQHRWSDPLRMGSDKTKWRGF
jgi:hypothetical protein